VRYPADAIDSVTLPGGISRIAKLPPVKIDTVEPARSPVRTVTLPVFKPPPPLNAEPSVTTPDKVKVGGGGGGRGAVAAVGGADEVGAVGKVRRSQPHRLTTVTSKSAREPEAR
jgi:hypothetical protein